MIKEAIDGVRQNLIEEMNLFFRLVLYLLNVYQLSASTLFPSEDMEMFLPPTQRRNTEALLFVLQVVETRL